MRRLLLIVMIALLPIRGLVGDAMAIAMVGMPAQGETQHVAAHELPCPEHEAGTARAGIATPAHEHSAHPDGAAHATATDQSHTSCDLCNGPAMGHPQAPAATAGSVHGVSPGPIERFASVEPLRGIKPPIS